MEYTEHYDNWVERNSLCDTAEGNGFRMLHDTYDADWQEGDEPHGTLIFTDEPAPQAIIKPPLVFKPPQTGIPEKVEYIEQFLKGVYKEKK